MNAAASPTPTRVKPDSATARRIKSLGAVGLALNQISNSEEAQAISFSALTALKDFRDGIEQLDLEPQSSEGMKNLIEYLEKKLKKRIEQGKS